MKVRASVKRLCEFCYTVRRRGKLFVYCKKTPRHKQRQWFASEAGPQQQQASRGECLSCSAPLGGGAGGAPSFAAPLPPPPSSFAAGASLLGGGGGAWRRGGGGFTVGEMHRQAAMLLGGGGGSGRFWGR